MRYMSAEEQENRFVKVFGSDLGAKYCASQSGNSRSDELGYDQ